MLAATLLRGVQKQGASALRASWQRQLSNAAQVYSRGVLSKQLTPLTTASPLAMQRSQGSTAAAVPGDHSTTFKIERYWSAAMVPLFPLALFVHGPAMDFALAVAIGMHVHWGLHGVVGDYARPFVIGIGPAKAAHYAQYILTALFFAGMLSFNYNDVGITKAFEMMWSL